jgi:type II secretory pathway pseudopilin PulG
MLLNTTTMWNRFSTSRPRSPRTAISLVELLIVVAAIGIIAAIALPTTSNIREASKRAAAKQNAKNIAQMSEALAALGVAHVIPISMGGVEATARLLREGVIVPEGPMAGERFILPALNDNSIDDVAPYLDIEYDRFNLRLIYREPVDTNTFILPRTDTMLCLLDEKAQRGLLSMIGLPDYTGSN